MALAPAQLPRGAGGRVPVPGGALASGTGHSPAPPHLEERREQIVRIVCIAIAVIIIVGWMIKGALDSPTKPEGYTNSHSTSPGGHHAFAALLERFGYGVSRRSDALNTYRNEVGAGEDAALWLIEPQPEWIEEHGRELHEFAEHPDGTNLVVVLPKRKYRQALLEGETIEGNGDGIPLTEGAHSLSVLEDVLQALGLEHEIGIARGDPAALRGTDDRGEERSFKAPDMLQYFTLDPAGQLETDFLLTAEDDSLVALRIGRPAGQLLLVSDPDVFANRFIGRDDAAFFAMAMAEMTGAKTCIIDERVHGFSAAASVEFLAMTPPGLWLTLSVLLLIAIFAWREASVIRLAGAGTARRRSRAYVIEGAARLMARARDYRVATIHLGQRALRLLPSQGTAVHAPGLAASAATSGAGQVQLAEALTQAAGHDPGAVPFVRCAQCVAGAFAVRQQDRGRR